MKTPLSLVSPARFATLTQLSNFATLAALASLSIGTTACKWVSNNRDSTTLDTGTLSVFVIPVTHVTTIKGLPKDAEKILSAAEIKEPSQKCVLAVGDSLRVNRKLSGLKAGHYFVESWEIVRARSVAESATNAGARNESPPSADPQTIASSEFVKRDAPVPPTSSPPNDPDLSGYTSSGAMPLPGEEFTQAPPGSQTHQEPSQSPSQEVQSEVVAPKSDSACPLTSGWIYAGHFNLAQVVSVGAGAITEYDPEYGQKIAARMHSVRRNVSECANPDSGMCYSCVYQALKPWWDISREGNLNACKFARSFADYWEQEKQGTMLRLKRTFSTTSGSKKEAGLQAAVDAPIGSIVVWDVCGEVDYCGNKRGIGHIAVVTSPGEACAQFCAPIKETCRGRSDAQIIGVFQPYK